MRAAGALARRVLLSAGTGIALALVTSWPVLLPIGFAGALFLPEVLRSDGGASAKIDKVSAIAALTEMMRDTLNAAAGLGQAITAAARNAPDPIAAEARELAAVIEDRTVPIDKALRAFGHKLADPTGDLVVIALSHAARNSARDLAPLLADLARAARAEAAMRVRIGVARARTRTAVRVITGVVLGLGVVLYVFDASFLAFFGAPIGQLVLLGISGLFAAGFAWLARLSRPTEQPRLLYSDPDAEHDPFRALAPDPAVHLPGPRRNTAHTYAGMWGRG
ncbi:type II secretion system F family protein [Actinospica robiniae]|uniref:type II secretion system F family protein n=1 Tax=Actinospica robiniae TaxID=304901 RepID=UPI00146FAF5B|nr:type II secretion system F family protein [Actinospica robiniae]